MSLPSTDSSSRDYIAHLDGFTVIQGGWLNRHWVQVPIQLADSFTGGLYSFLGTCLILGALDFTGRYIPALRLRASPEEEMLGIDDVEIGEFAVSFLWLTTATMLITACSMTTSNSRETLSRWTTLKLRRKPRTGHSL